MFDIGPLSISTPVFLAPMTGVTDAPFRRAVLRHGAALVFSEMIVSKIMIRQFRENRQMLRDNNDDRPAAVQLAGCDPAVMAEVARINADRGAMLIDINFGCPVKKIVNTYAGSAMMRDIPLATKIMQAVVKAVDVPVTVKMRLGWDDDNINAPELARIAEDCGIKMITVHGRTRQQMYKGAARWDKVRAVRDRISLPLVINGDISNAADARTAMAQSGAQGVMIGRGAFGKPWIIRHIMDDIAGRSPPPAPDDAALLDIILTHFHDMCAHHGVLMGVRIFRKHLAWYCAGRAGADDFRKHVNAIDDATAVERSIRRYFLTDT